MINLRSILTAALITVCSIYPLFSRAEAPVYSTDNIAIRGFDVVAYFLDNKASPGNPEFSYRWHNVDWHFANQKHRDLFMRSPESYKPMFGGFCGLGAAHGGLVHADPEVWTIYKGQLILNQSSLVRETWEYNPDINIKRAQSSYENTIKRYRKQQSASNEKSIGQGGEK